MKNKKILGALAALCMGIILCVSSVFAVNYWYSITNDEAEHNTVTMGRIVNLSQTGKDGSATGVYQKSKIIFEDVTVKAPKWTAEGYTGTNGSHTQTALPKFDLVLVVTDGNGNTVGLAEFMKAEASIAGNVVNGDGGVTVADGAMLVEDIQQYDTNDNGFAVTITVTLADKIDEDYANKTFKFGVKIEVQDAWADGTHLDAPVENA